MDIMKDISNLKDKAEEALKDPAIKEKINSVLDKTDVDDKIKEKIDAVKEKFGK